MGASNGFELLDKKVKNWIWKKGWQSLRDIQEQSIEPILKAKTDVIISASTAAGKTEAAFLPACSKMCEMDNKGVFILYISPLKALINDQYRRLQSLCEILDIPVTPWHGDISQSLKNKQKANPSGIILITPESLESLFLNSSGWCQKAFQNLGYIIIDEFQDFSLSELKLVEDIINIRSYRPGEIIFRQGEIGVGMYIISSGTVNIHTEELEPQTGEVKTHLITQLTEGSFLGDMALVETDSRRTATAIAHDESVLIGFFKPDLMEICDRKPSAGVKILLRLGEVLSARLRETTLKIAELRKEMHK
jgi:hypothetical protein